MFSLAWEFVKRDLRENMSYRFAFLMRVFSVFFHMTFFYFLSSMIGAAANPFLKQYGGNYFSFVMIGMIFQTSVQIAQNGIRGKIENWQTTGTFEALLVTKTSSLTVISFSMIYDFFFMFVNASLFIAAGCFLFQMSFSGANITGGLIVFLLSFAAMLPLGIISAAFVLTFKKGDPMNFIVQTASFLLAGVWYPTTVLPLWLKKIAYLLPLTHSLEASRQTILMGKSLGAVMGDVMFLLLFSVIMLPISLWIFSKTIERAKVTGALVKY